MDKKRIKRIVTIVMACASISTLAFVGCSKKPDDAGTGGGGGTDITNPADEAVSLNKTTATIKVGGEGLILVATVTPNTVSQSVTWTSSDTAVATVSGGYVVGVSAGTATITATSAGGKTATCTVTVQPADVTPTPDPEPTTEYTVTFNMNGHGTAITAKTTVDGKITAPTAPTDADYDFGGWFETAACDGTAVDFTTKAFTADTTLYAKWTAKQSTDPTPDPTPSDYTANGTYTLDIENAGATASIYTFDNTGGGGFATATDGIKMLKITASKGAYDHFYINLKLQKNKVITITGKGRTSNQTDSTKSVTIGVALKSGSTGAVTGLAESFTITQPDGLKDINLTGNVTTEGTIVLDMSRTTGSTGCEITELTVTISDAGPVAVTGITLNKTTSELKVGKEETLTATVSPNGATNKNVTWSSSDNTVATVDATGKVTALKAGSATITATTEDGSKTATCTYTVSNVAVTGISFASTGTKIGINDEITLTPTIAPADATIKTVTWSSSNSAVATVENGVVKGVAVGTATITATTTDGNKTATYTVEVLAAIVKVESVAFANATGTANTETEEKTIQLTPIFTPTEPTNKNVTWTSDNPTVASVDSNGLVTAHKKSGTAVITVTTEDGAKTATYTLKVEGPAITANTPVISKQSADELETAYVEWTVANKEGVWFNVYYMADNGSTWTQLDDPLVRQYSDYYRADMVGLKAGTYKMKVVPVVNDAEVSGVDAIASNITVKAHDRSGYGFVNGSSSGAYNDDGTLKSNAQVVYVTEQTKNSVQCMGITGVQNIIAALKAQKTINVPVAFRFIGNVSDPANMPNGDLYIDDVQQVTIEGIGNDATANGYGIVIKNSSNVEIRNLAFMNCNSKEGDDVGLQQANDHVWVHNNDFFYGDAGSDADQVKGDGALDTKKSTYVTHSYNHFWDCGKCNLQGMKDETTSNYITYHHNWYDHSDSRHPRIRTCTVHIYNNYFDGNAKYGVGVTMGASAFVENNYFRSTATMKPMMSSSQGTDAQGEGTFSGETGGIIKSFGNVYTGGGTVSLKTYQQGGFNGNPNDSDCYEASSRDEQVPSTVKTVSGGTAYSNFDTKSDFYKYTVETPEQAKTNCERYAGRLDGGDFKWEFDDKVDDPSYAVNTALKAKLTSYDDAIVKIGNVATGSTGGGSSGGSTGGETGGSTGGETGGGESGGSTTPVEGDAVIYCASGDSSLTENSVTISGNYKSGLSVTVNGKTVSNPLKMESSTSVTFTLSGTYTIKLYVVDGNGAAAANTKIKVNGTAVTSDLSGIATAKGISGNVSITKGDSCNLVYISLTKTA